MNVATDFENVESLPFEQWLAAAEDQFHFLQRDIEEVRKVVSVDDKDPENRMGLDETVLEGVGQLEEFSGRNLMVVAALGGPHYLIRTAVGRRNTIFVVVDDRDVGKVVTKFYWNMAYYWCNFGMNMPGGCIATDRLARYDVYVSPGAAFVVIVGPAERCGADRTTWFRSMKNAIPLAKLIRCHSWEIEPLQLPSGEWPAQVLFDPRPHLEHVAYIVKSRRTTFVPVDDLYDTHEGGLYRYDVQEHTILQQLFGVTCVQCLRDGEQLLVMLSENINDDDPDDLFQIYSVLVLDSASFTPLLKYRNNPYCEGPLNDITCFPRPVALYSADFKTISFFTWHKNSMSDVLILTLGATCLTLMTLKESCRAAIMQHTRVQDFMRLPLPESLKSYLHGL